MLWITTCNTKKMEGTWVKEGIWDAAVMGCGVVEKKLNF
jgi:hypothetical protein